MRGSIKADARANDSLYRKVRAAFLVQGTSLGAWCDARGISRSRAREALKGIRKGPSASALRNRVLHELIGRGDPS
jgi:hypothetical protein